MANIKEMRDDPESTFPRLLFRYNEVIYVFYPKTKHLYQKGSGLEMKEIKSPKRRRTLIIKKLLKDSRARKFCLKHSL